MSEMVLTPEVRVSEVAAQYPAALRMLEALGIDYCCGGKLPLNEAAAKAGVPVEAVIKVLQTAIAQAAQTGGPARDWQSAPLSELMDYIVATHHTYMYRELPRLAATLARVAQVHGPNHGEVLQPLVEVYAELKAELESHLATEEQEVFPAIRALEAGHAPAEMAAGIAELEDEHAHAGAALEAMHRLTGHFTPPEDACTTFCALYDGLQALEHDIHQHIHLENNILFPRARRLAATYGQAA